MLSISQMKKEALNPIIQVHAIGIQNFSASVKKEKCIGCELHGVGLLGTILFIYNLQWLGRRQRDPI